MRIRHRIPSIFNLAMVDVLCCALGCVILLWLVNFREAKQRAQAASRSADELKLAQASLASTGTRLGDAEARLARQATDLDRLRADAAAASGRADAAEKMLAATRSELAGARTRLDEREKALTGLQATAADTAERLDRKTRESAVLASELADARQRVAGLEGQTRSKEDEARALSRTAAGLREQLQDAEARASQADILKTEVQRDRGRAADLDARVQGLERTLRLRDLELAGARRRAETLADEKQSLVTRVDRVRAAAENRFAGLELTGRRVVFLVDMSGSMEMVDDRTAAPEKWAAVRESLGRVMRSLPDLQQFQVILFSTSVSYPLGSEGQWIDFDAGMSPARVEAALAAVKPKGNTDMHAAFEAAFRMRPLGLDTVYLFSDGLPNVGRGLDADQTARLKEAERSEILGRYVRDMLRLAWNRPEAGRRVRINTVGFFYESPDVGAFLWALARENDGGFAGMSRP